MFEQNLCGPRSENKSEVSDRPYSEVSEEALQNANRLERRNERLETIVKASSIIDSYIQARLNINDFEDREELAGLRSVKAVLAKAAGQSIRSFAKLSGRTYGKPQGAGAYWQTQRDISDPADEAESGVDFDSDTDDVDVDPTDFLKMIDSADIENDDETSAHLHRCGLHLCKAKLAHLAGDHEQCTRSINAAMASYGKFHQAMAATED